MLSVPAARSDIAAPPPATKQRRFRLHDDWAWIIERSWSLRFMFLAFLFSAFEVGLPLVSSIQGLPFYPALIGLTTGAAFVSRLVAQKKDGV